MTDLELVDRAILTRPFLYISGPMARRPYTGPRDAMILGQQLWRAGWHPSVPHLNSLWELSAGPLDPNSADDVTGWIEYDLSMLSRCDALTRIPGQSTGSDREAAIAAQKRILELSVEDALRGPHEFLTYDSASGRWLRLDRSF